MNIKLNVFIKCVVMKILKFGGKSLETTEKTQKICKYIKKIYEKDKKIIIVVSAKGSTTDSLIELSQPFNASKIAKRELDVLLSTGETISASLLAMNLISLGIPAKSFQAWQVKINTMGDHQNSLITSIDKQSVEECLSKNVIAVITGFQGINKHSDITTLGRGGSDTTAAAIGASFQTNVELYSDFNGVYSCDPRDIKTKKLKNVSLDELDAISRNGSRVVCNRAVKIAKHHNISLIFKASSTPKNKGTIANNIEKNNVFICTNQNLCKITISLTQNNKLNFILKNVKLWLKNIELYNLELNSHNISLLINQSDKEEVLNLLKRNLRL